MFQTLINQLNFQMGCFGVGYCLVGFNILALRPFVALPQWICSIQIILMESLGISIWLTLDETVVLR